MLWIALPGLLLAVAVFPLSHPAAARNFGARSAFGTEGANAYSTIDEVGRAVSVPAAVKRIVSLAPNITEIVYALGEGDRLVGDTDFCDYPAAAAQKPRIGGPVNPNLEQIAALTPDLVLATKSINRPETVDTLARIGLPVYVTDPHSVEQMIVSVEHIGKVLHAEKAAAALADNLRERLSELDRRMTGVAPSRVLFAVWIDPLISVGQRTFIADALRRAGARSVVDTTVEWPRVSMEQIVHLQPEFLVFASAHDGDTKHDIDALRGQPGWRELEALRKGKIVVIGEAIDRPAPRMVDTVEELARALHPDLFVSSAAMGRSPARAADSTEEACACVR